MAKRLISFPILANSFPKSDTQAETVKPFVRFTIVSYGLPKYASLLPVFDWLQSFRSFVSKSAR